MKNLHYAALALVAISSSAMAQRADHKITGEAYRAGEVGTYQRHARDYGQMLYYGTRCEQPITAQAAKEHVAGVRRSVQAANKALDEIKKSKPETAKRIDDIKKRHTKVIVKCDEIDKHLAAAGKDADLVCDCCVDILDELEAAEAETAKLKDDLKVKEPPKPAKAAPKK